MDSTQPNDWTWAQMSPELTDTEKRLRDAFVNEYLIDYDAYKACIRVGFQKTFAPDYAVRFMGETYVQRRIKELEQTIEIDDRQTEAYNKKRIMAILMKEANDIFNKGSTRVAAAAKLATIHGMDKPVTQNINHTHRGGVLMVPAIANIDDWEAMAVASQEKLVESARH